MERIHGDESVARMVLAGNTVTRKERFFAEEMARGGDEMSGGGATYSVPG